MDIVRVSEARSPDEMSPAQIDAEIDRLDRIAKIRHDEGNPITMINMRISSLIDEMEKRGLLPDTP